jgi:RNA polymerase sigma factor (sigma-70 family)
VPEATTQDPVDALVATVRDGREPSTGEMQAVIRILRLWLSRRGLNDADREEVCSDAVLRLIEAARGGGLNPAKPPGAWLRVVADHLAIDALRRARRVEAVAFDEHRHAAGDEDERLAALLDRTAAKGEIRRAAREAARAGEHEVVSVVATWLALTRANGREASSREVSKRLGISHMTVQRALARFAQRLPSR